MQQLKDTHTHTHTNTHTPCSTGGVEFEPSNTSHHAAPERYTHHTTQHRRCRIYTKQHPTPCITWKIHTNITPRNTGGVESAPSNTPHHAAPERYTHITPRNILQLTLKTTLQLPSPVNMRVSHPWHRSHGDTRAHTPTQTRTHTHTHAHTHTHTRTRTRTHAHTHAHTHNSPVLAPRASAPILVYWGRPNGSYWRTAPWPVSGTCIWYIMIYNMWYVICHIIMWYIYIYDKWYMHAIACEQYIHLMYDICMHAIACEQYMHLIYVICDMSYI